MEAIVRRFKLALVLILALAAGHAATSRRHDAGPPDASPPEATVPPWTGIQVPALPADRTLPGRDGALRVLRQGDDEPRRAPRICVDCVEELASCGPVDLSGRQD
jgi:hypothetical protein